MSFLINSYVTLQEFKDYFDDAGTVDTADDGVIIRILNGVSRFVDSQTRGRWFYPRTQTRLFTLPITGEGWRNNRTLRVDADLLEVVALTNGEGQVVDSGSYYLAFPNTTPYWGVVLKETAGVIWQYSTAGNREYVVSLNGIWGYHGNYSEAYSSASTLSAAVNNAVTTVPVATGTGSSFTHGHILRVDDEFMACNGVATDNLTVKRGINGSVAVAHLINAPVKVYLPMSEVSEACQMIALNVYRRFGKNTQASGDVQITGAGVVVTPKDVSGIAKATIESLKSRKIVMPY